MSLDSELKFIVQFDQWDLPDLDHIFNIRGVLNVDILNIGVLNVGIHYIGVLNVGIHYIGVLNVGILNIGVLT